MVESRKTLVRERLMNLEFEYPPKHKKLLFFNPNNCFFISGFVGEEKMDEN